MTEHAGLSPCSQIRLYQHGNAKTFGNVPDNGHCNGEYPNFETQARVKVRGKSNLAELCCGSRNGNATIFLDKVCQVPFYNYFLILRVY